MKKRPKKLTLNRETVCLMEEQVLRPVAGGNTQSECYCSYTNCSSVCIFDPGCSGPC